MSWIIIVVDYCIVQSKRMNTGPCGCANPIRGAKYYYGNNIYQENVPESFETLDFSEHTWNNLGEICP